jgi:hypothetical protein
VKSGSRVVIYARRFLWRFEFAKPSRFLSVSYLGNPAAVFSARNPLVWGRTVTSGSPIAITLASVAQPQILTPVVKTVAIYMVNEIVWPSHSN